MSNLFTKLNNIFLLATINPLIAGMLGAAILLLIVDIGSPSHRYQIATVDITGIVNQFVQSQAKLNLPPQELKQRVNVFGHQLENTLDTLANKRHVVLMPQEAVITGAEDLTPLVKQYLNTMQLLSQK